MSIPIGLHYHLEAFVCGPACIKPSPFEGWATFAQIFNARPDGCRFAIVRVVPVYERRPRGDYIVWDLYASPIGGTHGTYGAGLAYGDASPPAPLWQGKTADGMIMKAMALYARD